MPDEHRVTAGQSRKALWQIVLARHCRISCQDRNDTHTADQGRLDFQPYEVISIIQPPTAPLVGPR